MLRSRRNLRSYNHCRIYSRKISRSKVAAEKEADFNDVTRSSLVRLTRKNEHRAWNVMWAFPSRIFTSVPDSAPLRLHRLKPRCKISFLARTCNVPIYSKMRPGSDPTASCSFSFSPFLFDAASSDVVHPAFLHISQSPRSAHPRKNFPQRTDLLVFFYFAVRARDQPATNFKLLTQQSLE